MTTDPLYTDTIYSHPRRPRETPGTPENVEDRLRRFRMWGDQPDGIILDAADAIRDLAKERDTVRDELAAEKAKNIAMTADRNRLADKLRTINELLEPQAWAEGSRNRTLIMAALHGVEVKV